MERLCFFGADTRPQAAYDKMKARTQRHGAFSSADICRRIGEEDSRDNRAADSSCLEKEGLKLLWVSLFWIELTRMARKFSNTIAGSAIPTQAILLRADFDFAMRRPCSARDLGSVQAKSSNGASVCVVVASEAILRTPNRQRDHWVGRPRLFRVH